MTFHMCRRSLLTFVFCVAGVVFGEVGQVTYLLRALEMTFDMCGRSLVTFILCGRRSIW